MKLVHLLALFEMMQTIVVRKIRYDHLGENIPVCSMMCNFK